MLREDVENPLLAQKIMLLNVIDLLLAITNLQILLLNLPHRVGSVLLRTREFMEILVQLAKFGLKLLQGIFY